ncbi:dienelactone hydrolase family protein [Herbiconiux sp. CPCC 205716]|uniref:Dienelactone hydrolase family protein n=1 Tax=Herbiconiux gentiana TaxID=2970912 RepID=A0ABT2GCW3_9MICO|nr:dienelactone hydrolase family protein [Herbiconiux gentiana]MCS5713145.1 dienelactone hydrolase family protein [Herbiconiux gentiana]
MPRDVQYAHDGTRMRGLLFSTPGVSGSPTIVLVHDAFGLNGHTLETAERYAALGFTVFAADVWGDRLTPQAESEIGPLIGGMVGDRARWISRIAAAHEAAAAQPEVDASALVTIGYCFGGSSALEYLRTGGRTRGVVSIHGGLDLLAPDWSGARTDARVLVCTGADDPMATREQRAALETAMTGAGLDWETDLYSDTKHAFTNPSSSHSPMPHVVAYNPRSAARAWESTTRLLGELFPEIKEKNHA